MVNEEGRPAMNDNYDRTAGGSALFVVDANGPMSQILAQNWWLVALRGVFALIFGVIAVLLPGVTITALVLLFAAYMLVDGIFAIVSGVRAARRHERWGLLIVEGIADLVAGGIAIVWPLITVVAFIYLLAAWAIVTGGLAFAAALRLQLDHGRWLLAFGGFVSLIWGFMLLFWPLVGAVVLAWWMGAYALVFGVTLLILAFRLRGQMRRASPTPAASHA
jgi:uncharacterized membrane protein HdeD (DUF308 family)